MADDVLVIGAGITGLATAFRLQRAGAVVRVLEAADRVGGVIGTVERDGCRFERGPNSALDTTPLIDALLADAGILGERVNASAIASKRYVVKHGAPAALPTSPGAFFGTSLFSFGAKLALLREPFVGKWRSEREETVADFVRRRLGREFLDYAIEPFVAGIYAGDPEELSVKAAFPKLFALEQRYGSLIKGQILGARERAKRAEKGKNAASSFSFARGMSTLTDALGAALPQVELGVRVDRIAREQGRFRVEGEADGRRVEREGRAVVLTLPAHGATELVADLAPSASLALEAIRYPPVAIVAGAYRRADVQHALDGFGFLAPRKEGRSILGALFSSSMFPGRAPDGTVLVTTFVGGERNPGLAVSEPEAIAGAVRNELGDLVGAGAPLWQEVVQWPRAIPQYTLGHLGRMDVLDRAEAEHPGLFFRGNYRGGVSVGDCVKSAEATATAVQAFLSQRA